MGWSWCVYCHIEWDALADGTQGDRILTTDARALHHIVTRDDIYQKPEPTRYNLARIVGPGVLVLEGDQHKQQRRIMNPAFGSTQIRELTPTFLELSDKLRDCWLRAIEAQGGSSARLNALSELSRMTLDVIGKAGFGYDFNTLDDGEESNELSRAFSVLFGAPGGASRYWFMLQSRIPVLRPFKSMGDTPEKHASRTMDRIGRKLLKDARTEAEQAEKAGSSDFKGRDLFSVLVRANMATDLPDRLRMSDEDVLAQVPTFMVAGHETTATGTTWAIYQLTQDMSIQARLREELRTLDTDTPTLEELNSLPYLENFVKEVLRFYAPVPWTSREAMRDDVIPLAEPYTDTKGRVCNEIRVRKGQQFIIPIHCLHLVKSIWGEDADEFKPERWESPPDAIKGIPSVWSHLFSFLGGSHACIGFRFSVAEMKALLFVLVRAFEFELGVSPEDIKVRASVVQRPALKSEPQSTAQLPIIVRRAA
ncbi:cytochrome P450 [Schizophyllum amplum]|uniref:Cytochrome P450 n=1 Tax=Schizophyllum amplum TaxID=97359 RepID=A0A550BSL5_9AGAR|nr:cytochrome P450 [Auriculariopsis ampla]